MRAGTRKWHAAAPALQHRTTVPARDEQATGRSPPPRAAGLRAFFLGPACHFWWGGRSRGEWLVFVISWWGLAGGGPCRVGEGCVCGRGGVCRALTLGGGV